MSVVSIGSDNEKDLYFKVKVNEDVTRRCSNATNYSGKICFMRPTKRSSGMQLITPLSPGADWSPEKPNVALDRSVKPKGHVRSPLRSL